MSKRKLFDKILIVCFRMIETIFSTWHWRGINVALSLGTNMMLEWSVAHSAFCKLLCLLRLWLSGGHPSYSLCFCLPNGWHRHSRCVSSPSQNHMWPLFLYLVNQILWHCFVSSAVVSLSSWYLRIFFWMPSQIVIFASGISACFTLVQSFFQAKCHKCDA